LKVKVLLTRLPEKYKVQSTYGDAKEKVKSAVKDSAKKI